MIAKFGLALPFWIAIPDGVEFKLYKYEDSRYQVVVYPPTRSDSPPNVAAPDEVKIDGKPAFLANALNIEFHRPEFHRERGSQQTDPSDEVIARAIQSFVARLRYVTRGAHVKIKSFHSPPWRLRYLNDDGTELPEQEGLVRGRGVRTCLQIA